MSIGSKITAPIRTRTTKPTMQVILDDFFSKKDVRPAVQGDCYEIIIKDLPTELLGHTPLSSHIENPTLLQTRLIACVTQRYKNPNFNVSPVAIRVLNTKTGKKLAIMWAVNENELKEHYPRLAELPYVNEKEEPKKEEKPALKRATKSPTKNST